MSTPKPLTLEAVLNLAKAYSELKEHVGKANRVYIERAIQTLHAKVIKKEIS